MAASPTVGALSKAWTITDADSEAMIDVLMTNPRTASFFRLADGRCRDLVAAIRADLFAAFGA
ncbi:hypothetical protein [Methylobacterium nigriterrae]|uniref:hypothetical protein n=1 Tax=Methylobacterium nigriterrae TaxID=3127512 RepID=UPI0030135956